MLHSARQIGRSMKPQQTHHRLLTKVLNPCYAMLLDLYQINHLCSSQWLQEEIICVFQFTTYVIFCFPQLSEECEIESIASMADYLKRSFPNWSIQFCYQKYLLSEKKQEKHSAFVGMKMGLKQHHIRSTRRRVEMVSRFPGAADSHDHKRLSWEPQQFGEV